MKEDYKLADFVIHANVISINDSINYDVTSTFMYKIDPNYYRQTGFFATLEVQKVYKGEIELKQIEIKSKDLSLCDFTFVLGNSYILFGYEWYGNFQVSNCSKSFVVGEMDDLIEFEEWHGKTIR